MCTTFSECVADVYVDVKTPLFNTYTYTRVQTHKCTNTYTHAYIYIYHVRTHTHIHIYTHAYKMYIWTHAEHVWNDGAAATARAAQLDTKKLCPSPCPHHDSAPSRPHSAYLHWFGADPPSSLSTPAPSLAMPAHGPPKRGHFCVILAGF